jgi:hypothetical protein
LVQEADARDLGRRLGAASTTAWLRARLRLRPGEAKTRVDLAHRLRVGESIDGPVDYAANVGTTAGGRSMPATAAALAAGDVSVDHAGVIARTMVELPGGLSTEQERVAEENLASWARAHDPVTVGRLGRHLVHALDTATLAEREQRAHHRREVRLSEAATGRPGCPGGSTPSPRPWSVPRWIRWPHPARARTVNATRAPPGNAPPTPWSSWPAAPAPPAPCPSGTASAPTWP